MLVLFENSKVCRPYTNIPIETLTGTKIKQYYIKAWVGKCLCMYAYKGAKKSFYLNEEGKKGRKNKTMMNIFLLAWFSI